MKKSILFICFSLIGFHVLAQYGTQFENRGFESWANFGTNNNTIEPAHWHSTKSATGTFTGFLSQQIEPSSQVRPGSKGIKSARLWPVSVVGVTANGNLTNGRMNAGSMSATGSGNYNYTQRADERFNTPINTIPDSIALWVCFRCADPEQNAEARAIIHGDSDFRIIANGTVSPTDQQVAYARMQFLRTAEAGGNYYWRRLSIPFVQYGPCNDPRYILFTVTTNQNPGQGGTTDDLFVDDVLLIYNPTLKLGSIDKDSYHLGETFTIPFELDGTMSPDNLDKEPNQLIAQLSAANGSFESPIELGRILTDESGTITVSIPMGIPTGEHYRIRVVTTNYPMISDDNGFDICITSGVEVAEYHKPSLRVYPNPAGSFFRVSSSHDLTHIELYNLAGVRVMSQPADGNDSELSLNGITSGIYLVHCQFPQQDVYRKLVVQ